MNEAILATSWDDGHPLDPNLAGLLAKCRLLGNGERPAMDASRMDNADSLRAGASLPGQRKQS